MKTHTAAVLAVVMLIASALPVSYAAEARERGIDRSEARETRSVDSGRTQVLAFSNAGSNTGDRHRRAVQASVELVDEYESRSRRVRDISEPTDPAPTEEESRDADPAPEEEEEKGNTPPVTTPVEPTEESEQVTKPEEEPKAPTEDPVENDPAPTAEEEEQEPAGQGPAPEEEEEEEAPEPVAPDPDPVVEEPADEPVQEKEETDSGSNSYLEAIEREIHRLTNIERERAGVAPLATDAALANVAQMHSEDMAENDYFSHTSPDGCNVSCRLDSADYEASAWGENIAWRRSSSLPSAEELAAHFVESWMDSDGHRRNMLSENFTHEGVGVARDGDTVYATANFSDPR